MQALLRLAILLLLLPLACSLNSAPLEVSLVDTKGNTHNLQDYRGKWLVVNYWATWCPPCLKEIPHLIDAQQMNDQIEVIGLTVEDIKPKNLNRFVKDQMINYPIFLLSRGTQDAEQQARLFKQLPSPRGLPTTYIINPEGMMVDKHEGGITFDQIEAVVNR